MVNDVDAYLAIVVPTDVGLAWEAVPTRLRLQALSA